MKPNFWNSELGASVNLKNFSSDVNFDELFSEIYQIKLNKGGKKLCADDVNNFLKYLAENIYYYQHGGTWEFKNDTVYPQNSIVLFKDAFYVSTTETSITPETELDTSWHKIFDLKNTTADVKQQLEDFKISNQQELENLEQRITNLTNAEFENTNSNINTLNNRTQELENNVADLQNKCSQLEENDSNTAETILSIQNTLDSQARTLSNHNTTLNNHDSHLTTLEANYNVVDQRLATQANAINNLNSITGANTTRISELEENSNTTNTDIDKIESEISVIKENVNNFYTKEQVDAKISTTYNYRGTVETTSDLPLNAVNGDVYNINSDGMNYAWSESENRWDSLGTIVDVSKIESDILELTQELASKSGIQEWNSETTYKLHNFVYHNENLFFSNVQDNKSNNPGNDASGSYWIKIGKLDKFALSDDSSNEIYGGTNSTSANLKLYGKDHITEGGSFKLSSNDGTNTNSLIGTSSGNLSWSGTFTASEVYNAMFNDYAEFFEKGEETEDGDIIGLIDDEIYGKATLESKVIIGVRSDNPAMIVGGKVGLTPKEQKDFIPVAMSGRVFVKVKEQPKLGDYIDVSDIPGVGVPSKTKSDITVGKVVSIKDYSKTNKKVRILVI